MLALRLTRGAHPAVQLRRLMVAAASAGTGFLLLCALGHALSHPPGAAVLRLAWCAVPLAATVYLAVAAARTDPATRPRPGLSAIGLGPARLMAVSATTTALSCTLGSALALLFFLHLRGDLTGLPFDGAAARLLAAGRPLPLPAALTLLVVTPATASVTVAVLLRPRDDRTRTVRRAARAYWWSATYFRLGADTAAPGLADRQEQEDKETQDAQDSQEAQEERAEDRTPATAAAGTGTDRTGTVTVAADPGGVSGVTGRPPSPAPGLPLGAAPSATAAASLFSGSGAVPAGLPWGIAVVAAGLAVEAYGSHFGGGGGLALPGGLGANSAAVLTGLALTVAGLAMAGPGLTHLCGLLLQAVRPGAVRLMAGRILMAEAARLGRPIGVVCAVTAALYASTALYDGRGRTAGPLTALGAVLVTGCALGALLISAVEARQDRADTMATLLRLGAPARLLRRAALLRAGAVLALFVPLTLVVAEPASLPLRR
ncbi:MAG TPA: hypothetical protein VFP69_02785 [Streptomyces sp.]|nr:hypothetical protein [Streptomyces sp.]